MIDQNAAVCAAENNLFGEYVEWNDDLDRADVETFITKTIIEGGWTADAAPPVLYDVPDDAWYSGFFGRDGIHLHPLLIGKWIVLHELAHWLRPNVLGHGPQFCAVLVNLVRVAIGEEVADALLNAYTDFGVEVDRWWLDLTLAS